MKQRLVKLFSILLALTMIFALAACTNTNTTTARITTRPTEKYRTEFFFILYLI